MAIVGLTRKKLWAWTTVIILFSIVFKLLLPSVSSADDGTQANPVQVDLSQIKDKGKLVVITEFGPSTYYIYKDQPEGYFYDVLTEWGKENNIQVEFLPVSSTRERFEKLYNGTGDIVAAYTFTDNRPGVTYSNTLWSSKLMLLQRNASGKLKDIKDLNGKGVWVESNTNHLEWLKAGLGKTGISPYFHQIPEDVISDSMAAYISSGKYDYMVTDPQESARLTVLFPSLTSMQLGSSLDIAFATRNNAPELIKSINSFIARKASDKSLDIIYNKYFKPSVSEEGFANELHTNIEKEGNVKISAYDHIIRKHAELIQWDWRLLASLIYQESKFNPNAKGAGGAAGLMQLMPATASQFGAANIYDPESNIKSGVTYIKALAKIWSNIPDPEQKAKFILASYNIGQAHVIDAVKLAKKYGADPTIWDDNVELYLGKKMEKPYYTDPVVKFGYCNGEHACNYVESVFSRYKKYVEKG